MSRTPLLEPAPLPSSPLGAYPNSVAHPKAVG